MMKIQHKEKLVFYSLLIILVITRIKEICGCMMVIQESEQRTLFTASHLINGDIFNPLIFLSGTVHGGAGNLIYSLISLPFIALFGKSYFSLRLASIPLLMLALFINYKFCKKYLSLGVAIFSSLLLIVSSRDLTFYSVAGYGRYFHLNIFFILCLYFLLEIKERKTVLSYLFFGLASGLGIYFYPAFLIYIFLFGIFLFWDINLISLKDLLKSFIIVILVFIAGRFLLKGVSTFRDISIGTLGSPDYRSLIPLRFVGVFIWNLPNVFFFNKGIFAGFSFPELKTLVSGSISLPISNIEVIRLIFIYSFLFLLWSYKSYLLKMVFNAPFIISKKKHNIPAKEYIIIFILFSLTIYIAMLCTKKNLFGELYYYYLPALLNYILIIAIFLDEIWQKNKYFAIFLVGFILWPGLSFQYENLKKPFPRDFYKHYLYFYDEHAMQDLVIDRPLPVYREMCDKLNRNICYSIGWWYTDTDKPISLLKEYFEQFANGNINKLRYLYQGYTKFYIQKKLHGNALEASQLIKEIDKKYWSFCYIGLGEYLVFKFFDKQVFLLEEDKERIEDVINHTDDEYRKYLFIGIGEGIAKRLVAAYSPYITRDKFYDEKVLKDYLVIAGNNKEYKYAFLTGFFNMDIWGQY
jgi:hypothetical protein